MALAWVSRLHLSASWLMIDRHLNVQQVAQHVDHVGERRRNDQPDGQRKPEQAVLDAHQPALQKRKDDEQQHHRAQNHKQL